MPRPGSVANDGSELATGGIDQRRRHHGGVPRRTVVPRSGVLVRPNQNDGSGDVVARRKSGAEQQVVITLVFTSTATLDGVHKKRLAAEKSTRRSPGSDADRATGFGPACTITGTPGNDVLNGTPGDDVICGLGGNDTLIGNGGDDILLGGAGNDTLEGDDGNDTLDGGPGVDTCVQGTGNGTVSNCEALSEPTMSINDATVAEGNPGDTNQLVFTVTLASPLGVTATADYATADGTATAPSDYTTASGTLSIPAGATSTTVSVTVVGDAVFEPDETMSVVLSDPVAATLGDSTGSARSPTTIRSIS